MKKKQLIIDIQKRWNELNNKDYEIIVKEFNICKVTAKKYINMPKDKISKLDNITEYKKRKTELDDYINIIYKMVKDDLEYNLIYSFVKFKGYNGNENTLNDYIYLINKNNFPEHYPKSIKFVKSKYPNDVTIIKRNQLLKYILTINPKTKKDDKIKENIELIKQKYFPTPIYQN